MEGVVDCSANYIPLTPISFLERAASVYADNTSIIYATLRFSWRQTYERCLKFASAFLHLGIAPGHIVAALAPNVPALYELHFSVPMAGAVLSALNTRLDPPTLALVLHQLNPKLFFVDYQYINVAIQAIDILISTKNVNPPQIILISDDHDTETSSIKNNNHKSPCSLDYNDVLAMGKSDDFEVIRPTNECDPISVSFTSGSTGHPKGVVYSHRAAYLNSLAVILRCDVRQTAAFLWTLDMFRCNGWCLTWAMAAVGGVNVFIRNPVAANVIFDAIQLHNVVQLCGPPSILNVLANSSSEERRIIYNKKVNVIVAGGLLNSETVNKVEELGFHVTDGYGMTEMLGPVTVRPCKLELDEQNKITGSSTGLHNVLIEGIDVKDPKTMKSVPCDGKTIGEVMFRGNILMSGYLNNTKATQEAFNGGWYHTRDLGVRHPNGSIQMKDRAKDIITTEGEIISTLEVEVVLLSHPKVLEAAVVGKSDAVLKEVPCAFVRLKQGFDANAEEIIEYCGAQLPNHMVPKTIVFGNLPVNFNGKVQKYVLRDKANGTSELPNGHSDSIL